MPTQNHTFFPHNPVPLVHPHKSVTKVTFVQTALAHPKKYRTCNSFHKLHFESSNPPMHLMNFPPFLELININGKLGIMLVSLNGHWSMVRVPF